MAHLSLQLRAIWWRGLYWLLLPPVFLLTWLENAPQAWRDGVIKGLGFVVLMALGLACAAATGGRL